MIAVPITASSVNEAIKDMKKGSKVADIFELRVDFIRNPNIKKLLIGRRKPAIVTVRKKSEGGRLKIGDKKRIELFEKAIDLGVEFVDVELSSKKIIKHLKKIIKKNKKETKLIVSWHNFKKTDKKEINRKYNEIRPIKITRNYIKYAEGSTLMQMGDTKIICTASVEEKVPLFLRHFSQLLNSKSANSRVSLRHANRHTES